MNITINTNEPLSDLDAAILRLVLGEDLAPAEVEETVEEKPAKAEKKSKKKKAEKPEPMAEPDEDEDEDEPDEEEDEDEDEEEDELDEDASDEDLLALAVKKATDMVASGEAAKVREALDAAGASRVRELNTDNVREFFKALS